MKIERGQMINLIQQYLREQGFSKTAECLEEESGIMENVQPLLVKSIQMGHWKEVLRLLIYAGLPSDRLAPLYEHIYSELVQDGNKDVAKKLLETNPLKYLKDSNRDRYMMLESLLVDFSESKAFGNRSRIQIRRLLAQDLGNLLDSPADDNRLLTIIGQSLKFQVSTSKIAKNSYYDVYRDRVIGRIEIHPGPVNRLAYQARFGKKENPEAVAYTPDGRYLCIGTFDGFLEIWDPKSRRLSTELTYQNNEEMMIIDSCCLCLDVSNCSQYIVAGEEKGIITLWNINTGKLLRKFTAAHSKGITSVKFNFDATQILSASYDSTVKIHGRRSGQAIKVFTGHNSYCNQATYSNDYKKVISASSDGTVKIWDVSSADCIRTISFQRFSTSEEQNSFNSPSVYSLFPFPGLKDQFIVLNRSSFVYLLHLDGNGSVLYHDELDNTTYICGAICKDYLYLGTENRNLEILDLIKRKVIMSREAADSYLIGMQCHPFEKSLVIYANDGKLSFWEGE